MKRTWLKIAGVLSGVSLIAAGLITFGAHERKAFADDGSGSDFVYKYPPVGTDADSASQMWQDLRLAIISGNYHGFNVQTVVPLAPLTGTKVVNLSGVGLATVFVDGGVQTLAGLPIVVYPDGGFVAPTNPFSVYVQGSLGVDGGTQLQNGVALTGGLTADSAVVTGRVGVDGGIFATEGVTVTNGITTDTVTASGLMKTFAYPVTADPQQTAAVLVQAGQGAIGTAAGYTFTTATPAGVAFSATPICVCTDATAANAIKCVASTTACTPTGTSTDTFNWVAIGLK